MPWHSINRIFHESYSLRSPIKSSTSIYILRRMVETGLGCDRMIHDLKITWQWSVSSCPQRRYVYSSRSHHKKFWWLVANIREMQTGKIMQLFKKGHNLPLEKNSKGSKMNSLKKPKKINHFLKDICSSSLYSQGHHLSEVFSWLSLASHLNSSQSHVGLSDILFCKGIYRCIIKQLAWGHSGSPEPSVASKLKCFKCEANSPALLPCHCPHVSWFRLG